MSHGCTPLSSSLLRSVRHGAVQWRMGVQHGITLARILPTGGIQQEAWELSFLRIIPALVLIRVFPVCHYKCYCGCSVTVAVDGNNGRDGGICSARKWNINYLAAASSYRQKTPWKKTKRWKTKTKAVHRDFCLCPGISTCVNIRG